MSGTWSLTYDDSSIPSAGYIQQTIPLASIVLDRSVRLTTFTGADVSAVMDFWDGQLSSFLIGANVGGGSNVQSSLHDDFIVFYDRDANASGIWISVATVESITYDGLVTGSYSVIPEPSSALLGLVGTALLFRRRRH